MITHLKDKFSEDDLKHALQSMIDDMDWGTLRRIVEANRRYLRRFQAGGFQLKAQNAGRVRNVILKTSKEEDHQLLFRFWGQEKSELMSIVDACLEAHDDDSAPDEGEAAEGIECVPEETFEELLNCLKDEQGLYVLCFSPIAFSEEEESRLLDSVSRKTGREGAPVQEPAAEADSSKVEKLKAQVKQLKGELREAGRENRKLIKEHGHLQEKVGKLVGELDDLKASGRQYEEQIVRLQNAENDRIDILQSKVGRYQRRLEEMKGSLSELRLALGQKESELVLLREEKDSVEKRFAGKVMEVVGQLSSPDLIRALNEPDEVQELLLSAIRIPATDEASSTGPKSDDLNGFWARLLGDESETLKAVSNITVEAAGEPDFSNRWPDLSDQLVDLKYSLRARAVLINFIYEILRKFYDLEDYVPQQPAHPVRPAPLSPAPKRNVPGEALETLNLHQKIIDGLQARNIHTVSDLVRVKENELLKIKHFGRKDLKRLKTELDARGLNLGMNVRDSR